METSDSYEKGVDGVTAEGAEGAEDMMIVVMQIILGDVALFVDHVGEEHPLSAWKPPRRLFSWPRAWPSIGILSGRRRLCTDPSLGVMSKPLSRNLGHCVIRPGCRISGIPRQHDPLSGKRVLNRPAA